MPGEDRRPAALPAPVALVRVGEVAIDRGGEVGRGLVRDDGIVELGLDAGDPVGDHERSAGQRVVQPVRQEALVAHVVPVVVEHDRGGAVVAADLVVRDAFALDETRVDELRSPAAAIDREVVLRAGEVVDDAAPDAPGVGDEQQFMRRAARVGPEPLWVGGLVERGHRHVRRARHPRGERVRRDEDVVVAVVEGRRGQVGMADLPQDIDLVRPGRGLLEAEDVDGDVVARRDGAFPGRAEMDARRDGPIARASAGVPERSGSRPTAR